MKINTQLWSDDATSGSSGSHASITIHSGKGICIKVPCRSEGHLRQFAIKQVSGTAKAATVDFYMTVNAYAVGEFDDSDSPGVTAPEVFKVLPQISVSSGVAYNLTPDTEIGYPYKNLDGTHTVNQNYIYMVIIPTSSSGTTVWDALVMTDSYVY